MRLILKSRITFCFLPGLSKAEIQALTSYGSGEDENEEEETEEFEAGPVEVQTSLQVSADGQVEQVGWCCGQLCQDGE